MQYGTQITQAGDPLQVLSVERLYRAISQPKPAFQDLIAQLRAVRTLDERQYQALKKQLPYFVCGIFHPAVRRRENFASIEYFLLDLDHLAEADIDPIPLQEKLNMALSELVMSFTSPSGDGLKLMFRLDKPCTDSALFSAFYKVFARQFAERWGLMQAIDLKTSDVTRACFFSYAPLAIYRPEAAPLRMEDFINELDFNQSERIIKEAEQLFKQESVMLNQPEPVSQDALARIREKLNPRFRPAADKQYYVPKEVDHMLPVLQDQMKDYELALVETKPIQYGRMLRVRHGLLWAEVNIFYGKRGYRVIATTKSGSNQALAGLAARVIEEILQGGGPSGE